MPGTTPILGLPYPEGTDPVRDGDNTIKALAERLELLGCAFFAQYATAPPASDAGLFVPVIAPVVRNVGGGYSEATGEFTAPIAGLYVFAGTATFNQATGGVQRLSALMVKRGSESYAELQRTHTVMPVGAMSPGVQSTALVQLAVGDKVQFTTFQDSTAPQALATPYPTFGGYLLAPGV